MDAAQLAKIEEGTPTFKGISKNVYELADGNCLVRLIPSLTSYTYHRNQLIPGTDKIRLDFYELAAAQLDRAGIPCAFGRRIDDTAYLARFCPNPPFEVIVKNRATGSTIRKYPGLFEPGTEFSSPVVKFDFRTTPEDQPIAEDYVREYGLDVARMKSLALATNDVLRHWLRPRVLWDFCIIVGLDKAGDYYVTSEISPDCMRLRDADGSALDKDLFREGASPAEILSVWSRLVAGLGG